MVVQAGRGEGKIRQIAEGRVVRQQAGYMDWSVPQVSDYELCRMPRLEQEGSIDSPMLVRLSYRAIRCLEWSCERKFL